MTVIDKIEAHVTVEKLLGRSETLVNVDDLKALIESYRGLDEMFRAFLGDIQLEVPDVIRPEHKLQVLIDRCRKISS